MHRWDVVRVVNAHGPRDGGGTMAGDSHRDGDRGRGGIAVLPFPFRLRRFHAWRISLWLLLPPLLTDAGVSHALTQRWVSALLQSTLAWNPSTTCRAELGRKYRACWHKARWATACAGGNGLTARCPLAGGRHARSKGHNKEDKKHQIKSIAFVQEVLKMERYLVAAAPDHSSPGTQRCGPRRAAVSPPPTTLGTPPGRRHQ